MAITSTTAPAGVRARSRTRTPDRTAANPGQVADWMSAGGDAIAKHREHQERMTKIREDRAGQFFAPYRHFLAKGEEVDAIILDNDFGPGLYEHDLTFNDRFKRINPKTGRPYDQFVTSPCMFETDPLTAEAGLNPYFATFLTVALLRPWQDNKGRQHSYQRRLLALKGDAMETMAVIREQQVKAGFSDNPLRGVHVVFKRGMGDQSLRSGLPIFVERHSEDEIMETFGHPEVLGETDGKVVKVRNEDCFPIDYSLAFPKPSAAAIAARYNLQSPAVGSSGYGRGYFNDGAGGGGTGGGGTRGITSHRGFQDGGASTDGYDDGGSNDPADHFDDGGAGAFDDDLNDDVPF